MTAPESPLILAIDTCGVLGSVALGRGTSDGWEILGQKEFEGRSFSEMLVTSVADLLAQAGVKLRDLAGMVVVSGPGSFTGVRIGLSAIKGFSEADGLPVVAVSRLEVMAAKNGVADAALDAHRHEIYLRLGGENSRELLAGAEELAAIAAPPARIAVCDEAAAVVLASAWPSCEQMRVPAPTAADALALAGPRLLAGERADVAHLDGHYLRRSDAEIFGSPKAPAPPVSARA